MSEHINKTGTAVALGFFDGLHLAHRQVLAAAAAQREKGLQPCVLLFDDHPQHVLNGKTVPKLLQNEKRDVLLTEMGLTAVNCSFERIRNESPREFVSQVLFGELNAAFVSCGYNYRFGRNGAGDAAALKELCGEYGIEVSVCPEMDFEGEPVSSTVIRRLIENGEAEPAARLLGRPFSFSAEVIAGDRRGRLLGTPTVNQKLPDDMVIPRYGVYVSEVRFGGNMYTGVTNIGARPTFHAPEVRSETFILDFDGDLYGQTVETALVKYLRPVMAFDSADALKAQIAEDIAAARRL
jgi:riboflavin kinase/FMN adenylyltransferase